MADGQPLFRRLLRGFLLLGAAGALGLALPIEAAAADLRQGSEVTVGPSESVNDDLYAFGGTINVQGTVSGSVIASAGTITISGHISRDLIASAGTITVTGQVDGSIRAAGGTITLSSPVGEDVVIAAGTLNVNLGATIGRDLILAAGSATVAGPVTRKVLAGAGTLTLQTKVGGDVTAQVDHLRLDPGAQIAGNLDYTSNNDVVKASDATVTGTTTRHVPQNAGRTGGLVGWLRNLVGLFALGLLMVLLLPRFAQRAAETLERSPWVSLAIGAGVLVITPIVALIVFIVGLIVGGWWIGLFLVAAYLLALGLAYVTSAFLLGRLVFARLGWITHPVWVLLGGLVILNVVGLIPVLGGLVALAACLFGLGALSVAVAGAHRSAGSAAA